MAGESTAVLIGARVTKDEKRIIQVAASLEGENVSQFLKGVAVPEARRRIELAAHEKLAGVLQLTPAA